MKPILTTTRSLLKIPAIDLKARHKANQRLCTVLTKWTIEQWEQLVENKTEDISIRAKRYSDAVLKRLEKRGKE